MCSALFSMICKECLSLSYSLFKLNIGALFQESVRFDIKFVYVFYQFFFFFLQSINLIEQNESSVYKAIIYIQICFCNT